MSHYEEQGNPEILGALDAEERARTWWESGRQGNPPANLGSGIYGRLVRATFGEPPKKHSVRQPFQQVDDREYLPFRGVRRLFNAGSYAVALGRPLNEFWTLAWKLGGVERDAAGAACFDSMKAALRKHCRAAGLPDEMIYVHEKGREFGFHTHVLLHVHAQDRRELRAFAGRHIAGLLGERALETRTRAEDGRTMKLFSHRTASGQRLENQIAFQWEEFRYMMKGVCEGERVPEVGRGLRPRLSICRAFDLRRDELRKSLRMEFKGPRAGMTHSLAGGAQRRAGFVSAFERGLAGPVLYDPRWRNTYEHDRQFREVGQMLAVLP